MSSGIDIVGDIHGQADALVALLGQMGYEERHGAWRHPDRTAVFVGDFVDRGPKQVESVMIVRRMVDAGNALAVMGNHDFNAIAWFLPDISNPGDYLRPHSSEKGKENRRQHAKFLAEVENHTSLHEEIIDWLLSIDLMHAAAHEPQREEEKDSPEPSMFKAVDMLLKGMEVPLPEGCTFKDKSGIKRTRARVRWWDVKSTNYQNATLLESSLREKSPETPLPVHLPICQVADKPMFIGHYPLIGPPEPL